MLIQFVSELHASCMGKNELTASFSNNTRIYNFFWGKLLTMELAEQIPNRRISICL